MTDDHRPLAHFTPARNWMNDPNGLIFHDGVYHLFFQHNPSGSDWGNMSWGHATSRDLLSWKEFGIAIPCDSNEQIYSGSVVFDRQNTSGLGAAGVPPLVAVYTSVFADGSQAQSLASSVDGGYRWTKYHGNPVLDRGTREFRDPNVFAYEASDRGFRWIMVAVEAVERQVLIYSSSDLREWSLESTIGPLGPEGVVWECPDLFPMAIDGDPDREKWVLLLSTNRVGAVTDSSMTYLVGEFDGRSFVPDDATAWLPVDHGRDFYAAVTFHDAPGSRRIALGWAGNWQYAAETPTTPWRGAMSLPRELTLTERPEGLVLRQALTPELVTSLADAPGCRTHTLSEDESILLQSSRHLVLDTDWAAGSDARLDLSLRAGTNSVLEIRYDSASEILSVRRSRSGGADVHPGFAADSRAVVALHEGRLPLVVVVDACVVEVFADDGAVVFTDLVFPAGGIDGIIVASHGGHGRLSMTPLGVDIERDRQKSLVGVVPSAESA